MALFGKGGYPPSGQRNSSGAVIVPPKGSSTPCPPGWEDLQEDEGFVVYSNSKPPVVLGRASTLEEAQSIASQYDP
jgi:hypothetical protein